MYILIDSPAKFLETRLPPKEAFYNQLNKEHATDEQYEHAQAVWTTFKIKNLGEYHDLYMKSDVLLTADVSENFRKLCIECYGLDPAHYYTSPGMA